MPNLPTLVRLAASDKEFADAVMQEPSKFKEAFNLTDAQVTGIRGATAEAGLAKVASAGYES